ncbi:MAG: MFS transporter [Deltaproteobacteria bacterium]|nr:MFS transporter [Deltaproteobacteria bacterium]
MQEASPAEPDSEPLFTKGFVFAMAIYFLALSNQAVFFNFLEYLGGIGFDADTVGMFLAAFNFVPITVRPFISPYIHRNNAVKWLAFAALGISCSMGAYALTQGFTGLLILRIVHGLFFVLLLTSLMALVVDVIPKGKSGQAYSILTLANLLPYAVFPPLCERLLGAGVSQSNIYIFSALVLLLIFPMLWVVEKGRKTAQGPSPAPYARLSRGEILAGFKDPAMLAMFFLVMATFTGSTMTFFFVKGFAKSIGITDAGLFFTIYTLVMITVRLFGGKFMDKISKAHIAGGSLVFLAASFFFLGRSAGAYGFFFSAALLGLGWGFLMPVLGALIFDLSDPKLRTYNTNMMLEMIDAGYILGPWIAGFLLAKSGYGAIYPAAAALSLLGALLTPLLMKRTRKNE